MAPTWAHRADVTRRIPGKRDYARVPSPVGCVVVNAIWTEAAALMMILSPTRFVLIAAAVTALGISDAACSAEDRMPPQGGVASSANGRIPPQGDASGSWDSGEDLSTLPGVLDHSMERSHTPEMEAAIRSLGVNDVKISMDVIAAFVVAYDAHRLDWKERGVELTPAEFYARHCSVVARRETDDRVDIGFGPPSPISFGGTKHYVVDTETWTVIKTWGER